MLLRHVPLERKKKAQVVHFGNIFWRLPDPKEEEKNPPKGRDSFILSFTHFLFVVLMKIFLLLR